MQRSCSHRFQKRPIVLMELLVALALIGLVLSLLLKFFSNTLRMDRKIDLLRHEIYAREHVVLRLTHVFTSILPRSALPDTTRAPLYTTKQQIPALHIVFDNGIDPDPRFSGAVLGEIQLNEEGQLLLSLQPLSGPEPAPRRSELLLQQVKKLEFQFPIQHRPPTAPGTPLFEWQNSWSKEKTTLPSLIRILAKQGDQELAFAFQLPFAEPICYEKGTS